jgi:hypothetical protein
VRGAVAAPAADAYLCLRADLAAPARVFDSPIWEWAPPARAGGAAGAPAAVGAQPEAWPVAVWPVDSQLGTFVAVRARSKPPPGAARAVAALEAVQVGALSARPR